MDLALAGRQIRNPRPQPGEPEVQEGGWRRVHRLGWGTMR